MISILNRKRRPAILATSAAALLALAVCGPAPKARAQQFWDGPRNDSTTVEGGTGIWNLTDDNWVAGGANAIYNPALPAVFNTIGGIITLGENLSFSNLAFQVPGYTVASSSGLTLAPTGTAPVSVAAGVKATINAILSGAGGIDKQDSGRLVLNGANTYTGGTILSNGTLIVNHNSALGTGLLTITSSGGATTLRSERNGIRLANNISVQSDFSVSTGPQVLDLYLDGTVNLNGGTRTITGLNPSAQLHFSQAITGGDLSLQSTLTAPGEFFVYLFENGASLSGNATVGNGTFFVLRSAMDGEIGGDVSIEGNGVFKYFDGSPDKIGDTATVTVNSRGNMVGNQRNAGLEFTGVSGANTSSSTGDTIGTLNGSGTIALGRATLTVGAGNFTGDIGNGYLGLGTVLAGNLVKNTGGVLILSGANTYTGTTTVAEGTLQAGAENTLSKDSAVTVQAAGTLDLAGNNQLVGSIAGAGAITLGGATLTTGNDNTSTTFSGGVSGAGGLTKIGTGTLTLTGVNTYAGPTTVNRGTLVVDLSINNTVLSSSSVLTMGGGTFQLSGESGEVRAQEMNGLALTGGASVVSVNNNGGTTTTLDLGAAGITRSGAGTVDFSATTPGVLGTTAIIRTGQANNTSGILGAWATVDGGAALATVTGTGEIVAFAFTGYTEIGAQGPDVIADDPLTHVRLNSAGTGGPVVIGAAITDISTLTQNSATASTIDTSPGTLRLGASGGIFITPGGANLTIGTAANAGALTAGGDAADNPGEIVVGNFSNNTVTINSRITDNGAGTVSLTKTGAGTLTLTGTNTFTGQTTVHAGTLRLNATGGAIVGNVVIDGGTVLLGQSDQIADSATITISLGSLNISTFNETVNGLTLAGGLVEGSGTLTSLTDYALQAGTVNAILAGSVALNKTTDGVVTLGAQNTYTEATNISAGTLAMGVGNAISSSSAVTVAGGAVFRLNNFAQNVGSIAGAGSIVLGTATLTTGSDDTNTDFAGVIEGTGGNGDDGGLTKVGTGILTLSGQNLYSGTTTISEGTLRAGVDNAIYLGSAVSVASGATFDLANFDQRVKSISGAGLITLGSAILTTNGGGTTFSGIISGSGGLRIISGGTLTLSGDNTYTGITAIEFAVLNLSGSLDGEVTVDNGSIFTVTDTGSVDLGAGVTIVTMTDDNDLTNRGTLTAGDNSVGVEAVDSNSISNIGTLTVGNNSTGIRAGSNNNFNNGNTGIRNSGTLTAGNGSTGIAVSGLNVVENSGELTVGNAASTAISALSENAIFNSGTITFGDDSLGLRIGNANFYENTGTMTGGANSQGALLEGGGNEFFNRAGATVTAETAIVLMHEFDSNDVVNFGTLTGTGGIAVNGLAGGALNMLNAGSIVGDVRMGAADDILRLSTGQSIAGLVNGGGGTNALRLVGTFEDTLDIGTVTNFSTLDKLGGGSWDLTGTGTFIGGTTVTDGSLFVQGNLISNTFVTADGFLGGNGIITGNLTNFGIVSPGNSPGKLVVTGDYTQGRSGTLIIEIAGKKSGEFDVLEVGGRAKLDGTLRLVRVGKGPRLRAGDRLEFLTAEGGVDGKFENEENPFLTDTIIKGEVIYEDNAVVLEATQGSYAAFARQQKLTPNQRSVARMIDKAAVTGEETKLLTYLNERELGDLPGDFDRIAPEELTAAYRVSIALADIQARNIGRRLEEVRLSNRRPKTSAPTAGSGAAGLTGDVEKTIVPPQPEDRWGTFFTGTGQVARVGRTENARGYDLNTGGLTIGVDYKLTPNLAVGISAGYANTDAELTNDGNIRINGGKIGAYATYFTGGFHADGAISTGYNSYETRRAGLDGTARGRTDGVEVSAMAGAGYDWKFEEFTIGPTATLQYAYVGIDEFTERGSLAPMRIPDQDVHSFSSTLGFASAYDWMLGKVVVRPEIRAAWRHEFGDRSFALDAQLPSGAGGLFTVEDSEVGSDSFLLGAGVSVIWSGGTLIYLSYDGELGRQEYDAHNLSGGVRLTF